MPYDSNRVVLRSGKDDYINASRVEGLSPYCPPLVATQAPLPGTAADFWLMASQGERRGEDAPLQALCRNQPH